MQPVDLIQDGMSAVSRVLGVGHDDREPKDAIAILTEQHREVETLFAELDAAADRAFKAKERALGALIDKLVFHTELEEKLFYPEAKAVDAKLVLESVEEHAAVKLLLRKLIGADARGEAFAAKVSVLKELVLKHLREEEAELFPRCKDKLSDELLDDLGAKMLERIRAKELRERAAPRRQPALKAAAKKDARRKGKKGRRVRH